MPEIPQYHHLSKSIREKEKTHRADTSIVRRAGEQFAGAGAERIVIRKNGQPDKLVAILRDDRRDALRAKQSFYSQKIYSTLFPYNFPKLYASYGRETNKADEGIQRENIHLPFEVRERIDGGGTYNMYRTDPSSRVKAALVLVLDILGGVPEIKYPMQRAVTVLRSLGLEPHFDTHRNENVAANNFMIGRNGGEYYVEPQNIYIESVKQGTIENIMQYMRKNKFSDTDIRTVENSFARLQALSQKYT